MGWARFDDGYMDHPKVMAAGPWAELLDRRAIEHCAKYETDGLVSRAALRRIGRDIPRLQQRVDTLVDVGRWRANETGGWWVHDFLEYNPSRAEKQRQREQGRERVRRHRESRNAVTNAYQSMGRGRESLQATRTCARCAPNGFVLNAAGEAVRCAHEDESGNVVELRTRLVGEY